MSSDTLKTDKIYIPNLNSLRFFAALLVIIEHQEMFFEYVHLDGFAKSFHRILNVGNISVTFFFALSGFLITFLLFKEIDSFNDISVKKFYMRRILRIWPPYYICIIASFFIIPLFPPLYEHIPIYKEFCENFDWTKFLFVFFLIQNIGRAMLSITPFCGQLWSIGTEEQFYLFFPLFVKKFKINVKPFYIFIFSFLALKFLILIIKRKSGLLADHNWLRYLPEIVEYSRVHCMMIGGVFAYYFYKKAEFPKFTNLMSNKFFIYFISFLTISVFLIDPIRLELIEEYRAIIFSIFIYIAASGGISTKIFDNKYLSNFGNYSYGIYIYHMFAISISYYILSNILHLEKFVYSVYIFHILSILLSVGIAALSYHLIEKRFLKLKTNFTKIKSAY